MTEDELIADRFEEHRTHLRAVAYRMLGSGSDADDAVQEAWIRLNRSDVEAVDNLRGWLTTVVARISLDMLRSRSTRREDPDADAAAPLADGSGGDDPEREAALADAVGAALAVVLDTLSPAERLAFVLHDSFGVPFDQIATILQRSPDATKQLASRARRKVRGTDRLPDTDPILQRSIVSAFLAASRAGDFRALIAMLAPDVTLTADAAAVRMGSPERIDGSEAVAGVFSGRALAAEPALINGSAGIVWMMDERPRVAWELISVGGVVTHIEMIADSEHLAALDVASIEV